jgi:hypothetical protein
MRRVLWAGALAAAVTAAACGGGSSVPSAASIPAPSSTGDPSKVAQLDASNFDAVVLASARPGLVEFHAPT